MEGPLTRRVAREASGERRATTFVGQILAQCLENNFLAPKSWSALATCHRDVAAQVAERRAFLVRVTPLPENEELFALPALRDRLRAVLTRSLSVVALDREIECLRSRTRPGPAALPAPVPNPAHPGHFMPPTLPSTIIDESPPDVQVATGVDETHRFFLEVRLANGTTISRILEPDEMRLRQSMMSYHTAIEITPASLEQSRVHVTSLPQEWSNDHQVFSESAAGAVSLSVVRLHDAKICRIFQGPALPDVLQWDDGLASYFTAPKFQMALPRVEALESMMGYPIEIKLATCAVIVCDEEPSNDYFLHCINIILRYKITEFQEGQFADRAALLRFLDLTASWA